MDIHHDTRHSWVRLARISSDCLESFSPLWGSNITTRSNRMKFRLRFGCYDDKWYGKISSVIFKVQFEYEITQIHVRWTFKFLKRNSLRTWTIFIDHSWGNSLERLFHRYFLNLAQMSAIYRTFKNCKKKMGSLCLFSPCVPVILSVFPSYARNAPDLNDWSYGYRKARNKNFSETECHLQLFWSIILQLKDLKFPDLEKIQRNGQF